jgi:dienelactone hydrolase
VGSARAGIAASDSLERRHGADDFTVENVAIETLPGFFLCGNLYRPKNKQGPFPAILNPHGHAQHGRLQMDPDVPAAEAPPAKPGKGQSNLVAIGVNLARQGFVVFAYDMVGYNDTNQVPQHREFCKDLRPWLWNVSLFGLQTWNSSRALDYLASLPDVDPARLGMTGASGGGTQTFVLSALDQRVAAAVPVNMVSAIMQGGCLCENGPGLRVGTDNPEITALIAPRPLLLVAATGDWTKNNPGEEWPAIRKVYELYGKGGSTLCTQFNYEHNNNVESREAMYAWFGRWLLKDEDRAHFREKPFTLDAKALRVWNEQNARPAAALSQDDLTKTLIAAAAKHLKDLWPADRKSLKAFQDEYRPALASALAVNLPSPLPLREGAGGGVSNVTFLGDEKTGKPVLLVAGTGQKERAQKLADSLVKKKRRCAVLVLDAPPPTPAALWDKFFTCYNRTPLGDDVQAMLDLLESLARSGPRDGMGNAQVALVGLGDAGPKALLARALFTEAGGVELAVIDAAQFACDDDQAYIPALYAPGLRRAGGIKGAAMLGAPRALCLFNTGTAFETEQLAAAYRAVGAMLRVEAGAAQDDAIVEWVGE